MILLLRTKQAVLFFEAAGLGLIFGCEWLALSLLVHGILFLVFYEYKPKIQRFEEGEGRSWDGCQKRVIGCF